MTVFRRAEKKAAGGPAPHRPNRQMLTADPIERLAGRPGHYERLVQQRFAAKLSRQDAEDVVQEAFFGAAASEVCVGLDETQLDLWLRRAAISKALDLIKAREGQGAVRRAPSLDVDALADRLPDDRSTPELQLEGDDAAVFRAAFARLPEAERQVLGVRHFDRLPVEACAKSIGVPKARYERLHTDAVRRLINLVVGIRPHDSCLEARALVDLSVADLLDADDVARRDAHLAGCFHCRSYSARSKGLLGLAAIPLVTLRDRCMTLVHRAVDMVSATGSGAAEAGAGAGVTLGLGGAKLAAVVAASTVAVGGGGAALIQHHDASRHPAPARSQAHTIATTATTSTMRHTVERSIARHAATPTTSAAAARRLARRHRTTASTGATELAPRGRSSGVTAVPAAATSARTATTPPSHSGPALTASPPVDSSTGEFVPAP
jgi:RNA polymerase sigma factor (sigma-70 family)